MREQLVTFLMIVVIGSNCGNLSGQDDREKNKWLETHPIEFAIGNIYVGMPFSKIYANNFFPLVSLGTEFYYLQNGKSEIFQTLKIGGYHAKFNASSIFLNTEIGYRYRFNSGLDHRVMPELRIKQLWKKAAFFILPV